MRGFGRWLPRAWPTPLLRPPVPSVTRAYAASAQRPYDPSPALDARGKIPAAPYDPSPLPGTAPEYEAHLVLHPVHRGRPDTSWPSHIDSVCPLVSELSSRTRPGGSLAGFGVSLSAGDGDLPEAQPPWDAHRDKAMRAPPNQAAEDEMFWLYAYGSSGQFVSWPTPLSLRTLPSGEAMRAQLATMWENARDTKEAHIYVCTHGTRDCRCGVVGTELIHALRAHIDQHAQQCASQGQTLPKRVRVLPISHVGGHQWAANALVYPHGDWYGNLRTSDAPLLLRAALAPASSRHDIYDRRERLVVWPRWRGRLGMNALQQQAHRDAWGPPVVFPAHLAPREREEPAPEKSDTVMLRFRSHEGQWFDVEGQIGETLMSVAKRHNLPGIEATCGGELECATCHAYLCDAHADPLAQGQVDSALADAECFLHEDAQVSDEEDDMLEYALQRKAASRLTCQVRVSPGMTAWMKRGGRIELPPY
ncbi:lipoyl synthase [Malassezia caprae]|uniref:Lipoyl synthase n=1 Tax=Malassezia caprae TaxID=1381934 RepID=A0AAF0E3U2_9BASI|nr:lipoyl synthase [Malassezia caprae]